MGGTSGIGDDDVGRNVLFKVPTKWEIKSDYINFSNYTDIHNFVEYKAVMKSIDSRWWMPNFSPFFCKKYLSFDFSRIFPKIVQILLRKIFHENFEKMSVSEKYWGKIQHLKTIEIKKRKMKYEMKYEIMKKCHIKMSLFRVKISFLYWKKKNDENWSKSSENDMIKSGNNWKW